MRDLIREYAGVAAVLVLAGAGAALPALAADAEDPLTQAARFFADLEDDRARAILDDLSAQGVAEADVLLGYLLSDPLYAGRDYERAVDAFERAAANGNEEAIFQLAEARFWPDYSDWTLTPDEKAVRPSAEDAFGLLQRIAGNGPRLLGDSGTPYWRLAWLCTFGGYDCGKAATDEAIRQGGLQKANLRMIAGAYQIISILGSGKADGPEEQESLKAFVALGFAAADPFVAAVVSGTAWQDTGNTGSCPNPESLGAAGRLLALEGGAVSASEARVDFKRCFDNKQSASVRDDLVKSLDKLVRAYGNQDSLHLRTCYQAPDAPEFGDCLIHAVRDHYFACTKLSMADYFRRRFEVDYTSTERYARCRAAMITARAR